MWGGSWWAGGVWAGYLFDPEDLGTFILNLNPCFNVALGYAGTWYGGMVYAGAPFCLAGSGTFEPPLPTSNVRDVCIVDC